MRRRALAGVACGLAVWLCACSGAPAADPAPVPPAEPEHASPPVVLPSTDEALGAEEPQPSTEPAPEKLPELLTVCDAAAIEYTVRAVRATLEPIIEKEDLTQLRCVTATDPYRLYVTTVERHDPLPSYLYTDVYDRAGNLLDQYEYGDEIIYSPFDDYLFAVSFEEPNVLSVYSPEHELLGTHIFSQSVRVRDYEQGRLLLLLDENVEALYDLESRSIEPIQQAAAAAMGADAVRFIGFAGHPDRLYVSREAPKKVYTASICIYDAAEQRQVCDWVGMDVPQGTEYRIDEQAGAVYVLPPHRYSGSYQYFAGDYLVNTAAVGHGKLVGVGSHRSESMTEFALIDPAAGTILTTQLEEALCVEPLWILSPDEVVVRYLYRDSFWYGIVRFEQEERPIRPDTLDLSDAALDAMRYKVFPTDWALLGGEMTTYRLLSQIIHPFMRAVNSHYWPPKTADPTDPGFATAVALSYLEHGCEPGLLEKYADDREQTARTYDVYSIPYEEVDALAGRLFPDMQGDAVKSLRYENWSSTLWYGDTVPGCFDVRVDKSFGGVDWHAPKASLLSAAYDEGAGTLELRVSYWMRSLEDGELMVPVTAAFTVQLEEDGTFRYLSAQAE